MTDRARRLDPDAPVIVVEIGNASTAVATWHQQAIRTPLDTPTGDVGAFGDALAAHLDAMSAHATHAIVIASVVPDALKQLRKYVRGKTGGNALVVGETIPLPIDVGVADAKAIGVDRVCAAFAAYDQLQTACTVVDFGTAVTVDLIDDEGTLVGGAILPGLRLQLRALHEHTAQLPSVEPGFPEAPYGRDTAEAMQTGVCRGLVGAVRTLVEGYAESLNRWPQLVATGGDLALIAPHCDFLDTLAEHLVLRGVGVAYTSYLRAKGA